MSLGIAALQRRGRLSYDTSIGLLFVSTLAVGVVIISHSGSFATDATAILFGDILAITPVDIVLLGIAVVVGLGWPRPSTGRSSHWPSMRGSRRSSASAHGRRRRRSSAW